MKKRKGSMDMYLICTKKKNVVVLKKQINNKIGRSVQKIESDYSNFNHNVRPNTTTPSVKKPKQPKSSESYIIGDRLTSSKKVSARSITRSSLISR